jgi:hypothetical protein
MVAKCLSTCGGLLYLPETQENTRYKPNNIMDNKVKLLSQLEAIYSDIYQQ